MRIQPMKKTAAAKAFLAYLGSTAAASTVAKTGLDPMAVAPK